MIHGFREFEFSYDTPENAGISSAAVGEYARRLKDGGYGVQGYAIYRHGSIVSEMIASPYKTDDQRHVYSISKSWTGTAVGIAIDEGLISLDDKVISFFPDKLPEKVSDNLAAMTVADLLSMSSGHDPDSSGTCIPTDDWVKTYLAYEVKYKPGTHWCYDSCNQYMLCAIIERVTGMSCLDYLRPRLLDPLGIRGVEWDSCPNGINEGGWGIHVSMEDMLKLGITYLNLGEFGGERIFSVDWARRASSYKTANAGTADWSQGYGYTLWRCQHQCFRGDGAYGQLMVVLPEQDAVWIQISEDNRFQEMMDIFWETVYPSMSRDPLPENAEALKELRRTEKSFEASPLLSGGDTGSWEADFKVEGSGAFDAIKISSSGDTAKITLGLGEKSWSFEAGRGVWLRTRLEGFPSYMYEMMQHPHIFLPSHAASCFRRDGDVLALNVQFVDSPHGMSFVIDKGGRTIKAARNIDPAHPQIYALK